MSGKINDGKINSNKKTRNCWKFEFTDQFLRSLDLTELKNKIKTNAPLMNNKFDCIIPLNWATAIHKRSCSDTSHFPSANIAIIFFSQEGYIYNYIYKYFREY